MADQATDEEKKLLILKHIFDHVVDMTRHEDEKAGRVLAPMAFLTAANAAIYVGFMNKRIVFTWGSYDVIAVLFLCYIIFVSVGTILILEAFGPRFKIPSIWKSDQPNEAKAKSDDSEPKSIFFFKLIAGA